MVDLGLEEGRPKGLVSRLATHIEGWNVPAEVRLALEASIIIIEGLEVTSLVVHRLIVSKLSVQVEVLGENIVELHIALVLILAGLVHPLSILHTSIAHRRLAFLVPSYQIRKRIIIGIHRKGLRGHRLLLLEGLVVVHRGVDTWER